MHGFIWACFLFDSKWVLIWFLYDSCMNDLLCKKATCFLGKFLLWFCLQWPVYILLLYVLIYLLCVRVPVFIWTWLLRGSLLFNGRDCFSLIIMSDVLDLKNLFFFLIQTQIHVCRIPGPWLKNIKSIFEHPRPISRPTILNILIFSDVPRIFIWTGRKRVN